jgi:hypothetical protein
MATSTRSLHVPHSKTTRAPIGSSRPRDVRLTAAGRAVLLLACSLFAGAIGAGLVLHDKATQDASNRRAFLDASVITDGVVTRLWSDEEDERRVDYQFVVNGREYHGRVDVSAERRRQLDVGAPLVVRYVAGDPAINTLDGMSFQAMPRAIAFVVSTVIAGLGAVCLLVIRRQRHWLAEGRVAPAVVTAHHYEYDSSHGSKRRSMSYEFAVLSGATVSSKRATSNTPPVVGSTIWVLYDPERPTRNVVYPISLVTTDH